MTDAAIYTPDFRAKTLDGRPVPHTESPRDARRASAPALPNGPSASDQVVADMLLAMERAPWREPIIATRQSIDGAVRVHVAVGSQTFQLDPDDATLAAKILISDQAFPGCGEVAALLREAADWAGRGQPRRARRIVRSSGMTLIGLALIGLAIAGLMVARAFADLQGW